MAASKASFTLKEIGPSTDVESYAATRGGKTHTEMKFTSHLEEMLKEGISSDNSAGKPGLTYGHSILAAVVYEKYEMALSELETLLSLKLDYPDFGERAGRYVQHAKSLVRAIKAKRAVGKLPHVSRSKQKELVATLGLHFNELRACILNIEKVERYVRKEDISSTRWFMTSLFWSVASIFAVGAFMAAFPDALIALHQVLTHYLHLMFSAVAHMIWPIQ
jgi:hypothetical protein